MNIAKKIKVLIDKKNKKKIKIIKTPSNDLRSYHINSDKIKKILNFKPKRTIEHASKELILAFKKKKIVNSFDNNLYYNVRRLKELKIK